MSVFPISFLKSLSTMFTFMLHDDKKSLEIPPGLDPYCSSSPVLNDLASPPGGFYTFSLCMYQHAGTCTCCLLSIEPA